MERVCEDEWVGFDISQVVGVGIKSGGVFGDSDGSNVIGLSVGFKVRGGDKVGEKANVVQSVVKGLIVGGVGVISELHPGQHTLQSHSQRVLRKEDLSLEQPARDG